MDKVRDLLVRGVLEISPRARTEADSSLEVSMAEQVVRGREVSKSVQAERDCEVPEEELEERGVKVFRVARVAMRGAVPMEELEESSTLEVVPEVDDKEEWAALVRDPVVRSEADRDLKDSAAQEWATADNKWVVECNA